MDFNAKFVTSVLVDLVPSFSFTTYVLWSKKNFAVFREVCPSTEILLPPRIGSPFQRAFVSTLFDDAFDWLLPEDPVRQYWLTIGETYLSVGGEVQ